MNKMSDYKKYALISFFLGMALFIIPLLSFIAQNGMPFFYWGDFNVQQIPFFVHNHQDLHNFSLPEYDFNAGTGHDYIGAYGFYNLFSPFTLLAALLPESTILYIYPFLMMLKMGVCSLNAFIYVSRFCKNHDYAVIGALLYTFSGYQMVNMVFHYMDGIAFFPLLLYALEAAVTEKKRGLFAAVVAVCAFTNYYIFAIEVIFLVIYFLVRLTDSSFRINIKDFICLAIESIIGIMAAGIVMLPAIYSLMENPRFTDSVEGITNLLVYETPWRYLRILQSIFIPPDVQGYTNFFPDFKGEYPHGSRWSSQAMYLPLFGISGVAAYIQANKKNWMSKLTFICIIVAFVPALNNLFSLGSTLYYARWMFAPTLIMSLMTACALEKSPEKFKLGLIINAAAAVIIAVFTLIFPMEKLALWENNVYYNNLQKWIQIVLTIIGIILAAVMLFKMKKDDTYSQKILVFTALFAFGFTEINLLFGLGEERRPLEMADRFTAYPSEYADTDYGFRFAGSELYCNINLMSDNMDVYTFNSTINPSLNDYCTAVDIYDQDLFSTPASLDLLSAKYIVSGSKLDSSVPQELIDTLTHIESKDGYSLYENPDFIPMGFCYDYFISEEELFRLDAEARNAFMLKAIVIEDTESASGYLEKISSDEIRPLTENEISDQCRKRAEAAAHSFKTSDDRCTAEITLEQPELVFFSIAYSDNFTAYVDGQETDIIRANIGFMAVPVSAGTHTIELVYDSPARNIGSIMSVIGLISIAAYWCICNLKKKKV